MLTASDGQAHIELHETATWDYESMTLKATSDAQDSCDFVSGSASLVCQNDGLVSCSYPVYHVGSRPWYRQTAHWTLTRTH
jgi:hypothetical protein